MPPKSDPQPQTTPNKKIGSLVCGIRAPGPKYQLKTLVGYREHCLSRYRNPAYSFGIKHADLQKCIAPGPKYLLASSNKPGGFSFGLIGKTIDKSCGPGPKYVLPTPKTPAFTLKSRTKWRIGCVTPGPHDVKHPRDSPAFYIGERLKGLKCDPIPGPYLYSDISVRQRPPEYSLADRKAEKIICRSPGPKYHPQVPRGRPIYSFGTKHSECSPPYFVECDDKC